MMHRLNRMSVPSINSASGLIRWRGPSRAIPVGEFRRFQTFGRWPEDCLR